MIWRLKNFSLFFNEAVNAYILTPAYDLLNTRLHLPHETVLALDLFDSDFETESYQKNGYYAYDDFYEFGMRIGMISARVKRFLSEDISKVDKMKALIDTSFIEQSLKDTYASMIDERIRALRYSYKSSVNI